MARFSLSFGLNRVRIFPACGLLKENVEMKLLKGLILGAAVAASTVLGGCFLADSGKSSEGRPATLILKMGVKDVDGLSKHGLAKTATPVSDIVLSKLIVTFTSTNSNDAVIRDTVLADTGDFSSNSSEAQQVFKQYSVKSLRTWIVQVKTLDVNDSVIHISSDTAKSVGVGEYRQINLNLAAKYVVYAAKFALPDSLASVDTSVTMKQKLFVNRFMMVVDGDTVRDTTAATYFAAAPSNHLVVWNYVSADTTHRVKLYVFADSVRMADSSNGGTWTWPKNKPIFGDSIYVTSTDSTYSPVLPWTGPGSPSDPDYNPANPGGARVGLTIDIGAVDRVDIDVTTGGLSKRKK
jgi:hypothetical protein